MVAPAVAVEKAPSVESVIARLERLPISRELAIARIVIGSATFLDAYTVLAIAYAMPVLAREWILLPARLGQLSPRVIWASLWRVAFRMACRTHRSSQRAADHRPSFSHQWIWPAFLWWHRTPSL